MKRVVKRKRASTLRTKRRGARTKAPPAAWRTDYPLIRHLRAKLHAPVDEVGCERLADRRAPRSDYQWQCLVAAMLSSQTRDQATAEAMDALRSHGNTAARIASTPERKLAKLIHSVGFHNTKAHNIRATARLCLARHRGRVPRHLDDLLALPGVGPKMAHLTLHAAFGDQQGLCIDTHVHRISNALGWVRTQTPEQTREALETWLPRQHWPHINVLLVGLGQAQQQESHKLIDRCLASRQPIAALKLARRIGLALRAGKHEALDAAASATPAIRRLLV